MKDFFYKYSTNNDLIAIRTSNQKISYKELFDFANSISGYFIKINFQQQKYIPVISKNSSEFIIIILALWNAGLVPVPINTKWTEKEILKVCLKNNLDIILCDDIFKNKISLTNFNIISFEEILQSKSDKFECIYNDEAVVIFTSGTTGEPKGVVHTFSSLANSIKNGADILNQNISDRWLASLPFYHIGGFQIICRAISNGCEMILPNDLDFDSIKNSIEKFAPTHISLVSPQMKKFYDSNFKPGLSVKVTLIGGGFIDDDLILKADRDGWNPYRVYGSSETASFITAANFEEVKRKPRTVGKPIKSSFISISAEGEILISTNSLFKEYLFHPDETKLKIKDGYYYSGDLGFIDDDGYLFIEARRTDLIVTGGENVNPYEVENALLQIKEIEEACVFPLEDFHWGQLVAAAIVKIETLSEEEIKNELKKVLAPFKIPKKFFFVNSIPKNSLGKIEREKVRKMFN